MCYYQILLMLTYQQTCQLSSYDLLHVSFSVVILSVCNLFFLFAEKTFILNNKGSLWWVSITPSCGNILLIICSMLMKLPKYQMI